MLNSNLLSIVIVNWNAGVQLVNVIYSISQYHHGYVSSVIVVDNASTDDSLTQVATLQNLPFQLQIIYNTDNRGFGAACNQGAALAMSQFILFLNPDTRLFENSLPVPLAFMQDPKNRNTGVVGIQLLDEQNRVARSCARLPTLSMFTAQILGVNRLPGLRQLNMHMANWKHDKTCTVEHVIGAYYLIRRSIFESLGGFDERFFVYLEDLDLSLRIGQAGFASTYLAEAQAFHAGGGISRQVKAHRLFYSLRSRLLYGFKHFSPWQALALVLLTLSVELMTRTIFSLCGGRLYEVRIIWRAYCMLWVSLKTIFKTGRQPKSISHLRR